MLGTTCRKKNSIKSLLKEAEVYREHGHLEELREKYLKILEFIIKHKDPSKERRLIGRVKENIRAIENGLVTVHKRSENRPQLKVLVKRD